MHQKTNYHKYEKRDQAGSVLLITILILLFLTVLGISAMNMTRTEYQISQNYQIYNDNLYKADGAVMEVAQLFEYVPVTPSVGEFNDSISNATNPSTWKANSQPAAIQNGQFMWCLSGVQGSLEMDDEIVHNYFLYGRGTANNGEVIIKVGYRKSHP